MKNVYLALFSLLTCSIFAQPSISTAWVPTLGSANRVVNFNGATSTLSEGANGGNKTWDLSSFDTLGSLTTHFVAPSVAPSASYFTSATNCGMADDQSVYNFGKLTGPNYELLGSSQTGSGNYRVYSDPKDLYHFPISYSASFNDNAHFTDYVQGVRSLGGKVFELVVADGYGTLITKAGTFTNVLRVHTEEIDVDTIFNNGGVVSMIDSVLIDQFVWLAASHPGQVLANISHITTGGNVADAGFYRDITVTGISTIADAGIADWSLAPVPAATQVTMHIDNAKDQDAGVAIYDMTGRAMHESAMQLTQGKNDIQLNTSALADGVYVVALTVNGLTDNKKLVVRH